MFFAVYVAIVLAIPSACALIALTVVLRHHRWLHEHDRSTNDVPDVVRSTLAPWRLGKLPVMPPAKPPPADLDNRRA